MVFVPEAFRASYLRSLGNSFAEKAPAARAYLSNYFAEQTPNKIIEAQYVNQWFEKLRPLGEDMATVIVFNALASFKANETPGFVNTFNLTPPDSITTGLKLGGEFVSATFSVDVLTNKPQIEFSLEVPGLLGTLISAANATLFAVNSSNGAPINNNYITNGLNVKLTDDAIGFTMLSLLGPGGFGLANALGLSPLSPRFFSENQWGSVSFGTVQQITVDIPGGPKASLGLSSYLNEKGTSLEFSTGLPGLGISFSVGIPGGGEIPPIPLIPPELSGPNFVPSFANGRYWLNNTLTNTQYTLNYKGNWVPYYDESLRGTNIVQLVPYMPTAGASAEVWDAWVISCGQSLVGRAIAQNQSPPPYQSIRPQEQDPPPGFVVQYLDTGRGRITVWVRDGSWQSGPYVAQCFAGDTPILMADGTCKQIEKIRVGDNVASFDPAVSFGRGPLIPSRVSKTFKSKTASVVRINGLVVTPDHRFLSDSGRFLEISKFGLAAKLVNQHGELTVRELSDENPLDQVVYNFEVEKFHTYIAGGFRVHNEGCGQNVALFPQLLDIWQWQWENGDDVTRFRVANVRDFGPGDPGPEFSVGERLAGVRQELGRRQVAGEIDWNAVAGGWEGTYTDPVTEKQISIKPDNTALIQLGSQIGAEIFGTIGSQLSDLIAKNHLVLGIFVKSGVDAVARAFGGELGAAVFGGQAGLFNASNIATQFGVNLVNNIVGIGTNQITKLLDKELGLHGPLGDLANRFIALGVNTVTNYAFGQAAAAVGIQAFGAGPSWAVASIPGGGPVDFINGFQGPGFGAGFLDAGAGIVGTWAGTWLSGAIFGQSKGQAIGSQLGGAIGGFIGGSQLLATALGLAAPLGPIGILVGAFIGAFLGGALGSLFGGSKARSDFSSALLEYNVDDGSFGVGASRAQRGASKDVAENMGASAATQLNQVLGMVGGAVAGLNFPEVEYGQMLRFSKKGKLSYTKYYHRVTGNSMVRSVVLGPGLNWDAPVTLGPTVLFDDPEQAITTGVRETLEDMKFEGGDAYVKRAIALSTATDAEGFFRDLSAGFDYGLYRDNPILYKAMLKEQGPLAEARWEATLKRAVELDLDRPVDMLARYNTNGTPAGSSDAMRQVDYRHEWAGKWKELIEERGAPAKDNQNVAIAEWQAMGDTSLGGVVSETLGTGADQVTFTSFGILAIDLANDGLELTDRTQSGVQFDIDNDGYLEGTGWVGPRDGLLALDRNNNGTIDDASELFTADYLTGRAPTEHGPQSLASLDSNGDRIIDGRDKGFNDLRVWVDADQDGQTGFGELHALWRYGINRFDLDGNSARGIAGDGIAGGGADYLFKRTSMSVLGGQAKLYDVALDAESRGLRVVETEDGFAVEIEGEGIDFDFNVAFKTDKDGDGVLIGADGNGDAHASKDDNLDASAGNVLTLYGGAGDDTLVVKASALGALPTITITIGGGAGNDTLAIKGTENTRLNLFTAGLEAVVGGDGNDFLFNFTVDGEGDALEEATTDVSLAGGLGEDRLIAGAGNDRLDGGSNRDLIYGGDGDDVIVAETSDVDADVPDVAKKAWDLTVGSRATAYYLGWWAKKAGQITLPDLTDAPVFIDGGLGRDMLILVGQDDLVVDLAHIGIETLISGGGNDFLFSIGEHGVGITGASGNDTIVGGARPIAADSTEQLPANDNAVSAQARAA